MATAHVHVATAGTSRACAAFRVAPAGALHSAPFSSAASSPKRRSVLPAQRPARTAGLTCRAETEGEMREKVDEVEEILTKEPVKVEGTVKEAEETLGLFGNIVMWTLLSFLLAASLFFTTARSFLPNDMQPLDAAQQIESQR